MQIGSGPCTREIKIGLGSIEDATPGSPSNVKESMEGPSRVLFFKDHLSQRLLEAAGARARERVSYPFCSHNENKRGTRRAYPSVPVRGAAPNRNGGYRSL